MIFGIPSAIVLKNYLIVKLPTIKKILKTNTKSLADGITDFHDEEVNV